MRLGNIIIEKEELRKIMDDEETYKRYSKLFSKCIPIRIYDDYNTITYVCYCKEFKNTSDVPYYDVLVEKDGGLRIEINNDII